MAKVWKLCGINIKRVHGGFIVSCSFETDIERRSKRDYKQSEYVFKMMPEVIEFVKANI